MSDGDVVTNNVDDEPVMEALEALAESAVICAHYLLQYAAPDSMAYHQARMLLHVMQFDVSPYLSDGFNFCSACGTSGSLLTMWSSNRHRSHITDEEYAALGDRMRNERQSR